MTWCLKCGSRTSDPSAGCEPCNEEIIRKTSQAKVAVANMFVGIKSESNVLEEAYKLIHGDREKDYGPPVKNFKDIANLWTSYLLVINRTNLTPSDVAHMMILLKMARAAKQAMPVRDARDSVVDMAGYVGLLERLEE